MADPGFREGVRQLPKVLLFFNFFAENCMKMKEFEPKGGGVPGASLDPPVRSSISIWGGGRQSFTFDD